MKIKDFIKTDAGTRFKDQLNGCNEEWQVEHWKNTTMIYQKQFKITERR